MENNEIRSKIQNLYPTYTKLEKRIADYFLEHNDDLQGVSITALAKKIGTNPMAITRFCQSLHYSGFGEFKYCLQNVISHVQSGQEKIRQTDSIPEIQQKLIQLGTEAIYDSLADLDPDTVQSCIQPILRAGKLYIYSDGGPGTTAQYLFGLFLQIGIVGHCFTDVQTAMAASMQLNKRDLIIFICRTGESANLIKVAHLANKQRANSICITSNEDSPLAKICRITLAYSTRIDNDLRYIHIARMCEIAIIGLLQSALINQMDEKETKQLDGGKTAISMGSAATGEQAYRSFLQKPK